MFVRFFNSLNRFICIPTRMTLHNNKIIDEKTPSTTYCENDHKVYLQLSKEIEYDKKKTNGQSYSEKMNCLVIDTFLNVLEDSYYLKHEISKIELFDFDLDTNYKINAFNLFLSNLIQTLETISMYDNMNDCKREIIKFVKYDHIYYNFLFYHIVKIVKIKNLEDFNYVNYIVNKNKLMKYCSSQCKIQEVIN